MKKKVFALIPLLLVLFFSVSAQNRQLVQEEADTTKRTALVIGNAAYANSPLKNPVNDANDIAAALREAGFEVIYKANLDQVAMKKAIRDFGNSLKARGGVGLFYFAGHGVQVNGKNYLVPVDAVVNSEEEIEYEAIDAGFVLAQMEAARNPMNIVILDACRNNPFARSFRSETKGLAQMDAPSGTIIAYATAPGSVASDGTERNGIYTQELLKTIRIQNLNIEEVFKRVRISVRNATDGKQTPWESSSLVGSFKFKLTANAAPPVAAAPATPQIIENKPSSAAIELAFWDSIKNSTNVEDFQAYLRKYPNGDFADIARNRIKTLTSATKSEPVSRSPKNTDEVIGIGTYIPKLNAKVVGLFFFESGNGLPAKDKRVYATRFPRSSRYINFEVRFEYPAQTSKTDFTVQAVFYDENDKQIASFPSETYMDKDWTNSQTASGWGTDKGFSFAAGKYRVELKIEDQMIASGWFEIY